MKFLVYTFHDGGSHEGCSFKELAKLTMPSKQEYAKLHGYDFYVREDSNPERAVGWTKIDIALDKIESYDWMLYVECDAMIMNQTIRLESLIDNNYDIIIANSKYRSDYTGINTGVILVKCSQWSKDFLKSLNGSPEFFNSNWFEQGAIIQAVRNDEVRSHFKLVDNRLLNSYHHQDTPDDNFVLGDFICHAAGISNESRQALFTELGGRIINLPEDKSVKTPFFTGR